MSREVALAIGVSKAKPLPYLGGAVNGARAFYEWASKLGYDSRVLTDEAQPVTMARLRLELESILKPEETPIHRMVLYFAGHGLIREAEEGLWLLSDWNDELRAVAVEGLKRRLYMHSIQQIAIFADSCRSLPPNISAADLCPDPVLGRGPVREQKPPAIDKFIAAQDGSATFMVPGATPEEDRCLFSGVLMEGLWGIKREAFSKLLTDKVTSRSLGAYLDTEVPKRAECYKRKLLPTVIPTFPEGDDIYFGFGAPPKPPAFPEWPAPGTIAGMGVRGLRKKVTLKDEQLPPPPPGPSLFERLRSHPGPPAFETGAGFAVEGGSVRAVWTTAGVLAESHGQPNWWRLRQRAGARLLESAPVLIEFEDGMFAAAAAMPGFIASVLRDERGVSALVYRREYLPLETAAAAESAIAKMESGALRAGDATDLAVRLRQDKHADPMLGAISAYLYDSIGDIESIRRMAFFYTIYNQPIPYDVALLAQLRGAWRDGVLWARVPAVSARAPRTETERQSQWTHSATQEVTGEVGGVWPWMRQGWTFLDDPAEDGSTLITPGLIELNRHLAPGRFTTLDAEGGRELARIFDLANR